MTRKGVTVQLPQLAQRVSNQLDEVVPEVKRSPFAVRNINLIASATAGAFYYFNCQRIP